MATGSCRGASRRLPVDRHRVWRLHRRRTSSTRAPTTTRDGQDRRRSRGRKTSSTESGGRSPARRVWRRRRMRLRSLVSSSSPHPICTSSTLPCRTTRRGTSSAAELWPDRRGSGRPTRPVGSAPVPAAPAPGRGRRHLLGELSTGSKPRGTGTTVLVVVSPTTASRSSRTRCGGSRVRPMRTSCTGFRCSSRPRVRPNRSSTTAWPRPSTSFRRSSTSSTSRSTGASMASPCSHPNRWIALAPRWSMSKDPTSWAAGFPSCSPWSSGTSAASRPARAGLAC